MKTRRPTTTNRNAFVTNEWLIVAGILVVIVGVTLALPGKWGAIVGIPLLGLLGLSLFMSWLDDPARIVKKLKLLDADSDASTSEKSSGEQGADDQLPARAESEVE